MYTKSEAWVDVVEELSSTFSRLEWYISRCKVAENV